MKAEPSGLGDNAISLIITPTPVRLISTKTTSPAFLSSR